MDDVADGDAEPGRDADPRTRARGGGNRQKRRRARNENEAEHDAHIGHEGCRIDQHFIFSRAYKSGQLGRPEPSIAGESARPFAVGGSGDFFCRANVSHIEWTE